MKNRHTFRREYDHPFVPLENGRQHGVRVCFDVDHGVVTKVSIGYQVWFGGEVHEIVRYDSDHNDLHRHAAEFPQPGTIDKWFREIHPNTWIKAALGDIKKYAKEWQDNVIPTGQKSESQKGDE